MFFSKGKYIIYSLLIGFGQSGMADILTNEETLKAIQQADRLYVALADTTKSKDNKFKIINSSTESENTLSILSILKDEEVNSEKPKIISDAEIHNENLQTNNTQNTKNIAKPNKSVHTTHKYIYITFDDGPLRGTKNVLKILQEENVKATMFCVGSQVRHNKKLFYKELSMSNLMVANHTYNHANGRYSKFYSSTYRVMSDIEHGQIMVGGRKYLRLAGRNVWRLPNIKRDDYGLSKKRRVIEKPKYDTLAKEGFYIYGWDVEWHYGSKGKKIAKAESLVKRVERIYKKGRTAKKHKVVLLAHDFMFRDKYSVTQLKKFIQIMKTNGWKFETIDHYTSHQPNILTVTKYYKPKGKPLRVANVQKKYKKSTNIIKTAKAKQTTKTKVASKTKIQKSKQQNRVAINTKSMVNKLTRAVARRDIRRVKSLLASGVDVNMKDKRGRLALNEAIRKNSLTLVKTLLDHGAKMHMPDAKGVTPYMYASKRHRKAIKRYFDKVAGVVTNTRVASNQTDKNKVAQSATDTKELINSEILSQAENKPNMSGGSLALAILRNR